MCVLYHPDKHQDPAKKAVCNKIFIEFQDFKVVVPIVNGVFFSHLGCCTVVQQSTKSV